ncbi:MAG: hypothetical protein KAU06_08500 [Candidatus Marinimicrobia bacterium]|nr:hypothetical protein [Candidatus Neomarinimicrobiota bacterium]
MTLFKNGDKLILSSMFNTTYFLICYSNLFEMFLAKDSPFPGIQDEIKWILLFALYMLLMFRMAYLLTN